VSTYQQDYVLRLIEQMGALIRLAFERFRTGEEDSEPLELTEQAIGLAIDMDPELFLRLAPQSMVSFLELSSFDERVVERLVEALELQADILEAEGRLLEANVRREQASALRASVGPLHAN
jgi:hypothetical protein